MSIIIKQANTIEEQEKVFKLRYDIYIKEMNRKQKYANHVKKKFMSRLMIMLICFLQKMKDKQ